MDCITFPDVSRTRGLHTGEWLQWVMRLRVIYSGVRNYTEIHVYLYFENVQAGYLLVIISVVNEDSTTDARVKPQALSL